MHAPDSRASAPPRRASRAELWGSAALALAPFLLLTWRFDFLTDDAYISFRYAKNWAAGHGAVFNVAPGEAPVEGYTNFLWVALLALCERLGWPAPIASRAVSVAAGVALLLCATRFLARRNAGAPLATLLGALFLGTLPPLALWSTGGLEPMPLALAVFATFAALWGDAERPRGLAAGLAAGAACLLRADGFVLAGLVLGGALLGALVHGPRARLRAVALAALVAALALGLHFAGRFAYYGDWLPNTARAKVGASSLAPELVPWFYRRGLYYVVSFALTFPSVVLALALGLLALGRRLDWVAAAWIAVLGSALYAVLVGGDFMTMGRFLVPALPFVALLFAAGLARLARSRSALARRAPLPLSAAACLLSLAPAFDLHAVPLAVRRHFHFRWNEAPEVMKSELGMWASMKQNAESWVELGRALALHTQPGERLAYGAVGAVGYYSGLYIYDTYGLVSREIARLPIQPQPRPPYLKSPGHDRSVGLEFFLDRPLDYLGAVVVDADKLEIELPPGWFQSQDLFALETIPLDPRDGFAPGRLLVKLRRR